MITLKLDEGQGFTFCGPQLFCSMKRGWAGTLRQKSLNIVAPVHCIHYLKASFKHSLVELVPVSGLSYKLNAFISTSSLSSLETLHLSS